jgi:hypothetical protein
MSCIFLGGLGLEINNLEGTEGTLLLMSVYTDFEISIALFELALEPVTIKTMLPKQTLAICRGMLNLHSLGSGTVNTMLFVLIDLDE